jgi:hypothetical protein
LSKLATDPSNASNLASGTVPTARLGSGTASSSTVLYGDQTYKTEPGGAYTLLNTYDITDTDADIEVTSQMTTTYKMYYVIGNMFKHNTDSTFLKIQVSTNNGTSYDSGANYGSQWIGQAAGSEVQRYINLTGADHSIIGGVAASGYSGSNTDEGYCWDMKIFNSQKVTGGYTYMYHTETGQDAAYLNQVASGSSIYRNTVVVDAFKVFPSSGTFDQGRLTIYGIS